MRRKQFIRENLGKWSSYAQIHTATHTHIKSVHGDDLVLRDDFSKDNRTPDKKHIEAKKKSTTAQRLVIINCHPKTAE